MKWTMGDAAECRAAAADLTAMARAVADVAATLREIGDWRAVPWWQGPAADRAWAKWAELLTWTDQVEGGLTAFATQMTQAADQIDAAVHRAKTALALGVVLFVISTGLTIVTIGISEGAAAGAAIGAETEVTLTLAGLTTALRNGFTVALRATLTRIGAAVGFQLAIPVVTTGVYDLRQKHPVTWDQVDGVLISSAIGMFIGEIAMGINVAVNPSVARQVAIGAGSQAFVGFAGTAASEQAVDGRVSWEVIGINTGAGAIIGGIGAAGSAVLIKKYRYQKTPDGQSRTVQMTELGADGRPVPGAPPRTVNIETPVDPVTGQASIVEGNADGTPAIGDAELAGLTPAQTDELCADGNRLAAAGTLTQGAGRSGDAAVAIGNADLVGAVDATPGAGRNPTTRWQAQSAEVAGGRLRGGLGDLQAVQAQAADTLAANAGNPSFDADAYAAGAIAQEQEAAEAVAQDAADYQGQLQQLRVDLTAALTAPGQLPSVTAVPGAAPAVDAELVAAQRVAGDVGSGQLTPSIYGSAQESPGSTPYYTPPSTPGSPYGTTATPPASPYDTPPGTPGTPLGTPGSTPVNRIDPPPAPPAAPVVPAAPNEIQPAPLAPPVPAAPAAPAPAAPAPGALGLDAPDAEALSKQAAWNRIKSTSAWGLVVGTASGAVLGGAVNPALSGNEGPPPVTTPVPGLQEGDPPAP